MTPPIQILLGALRTKGLEPCKSGDGWTCRCPSHDDRNPSLSIAQGDNGNVVWNCHAGCTQEAVIAALGLRFADLMPEKNGPVRAPPRPNKVDQKADSGKTYPTADEAVAALERIHGRRSAMWTYCDEKGTPWGVVVRWDKPGCKQIMPVSRDLPSYSDVSASHWRIGGMPTPRLLYGLPEIAAARPGSRVYVTEGEKCADVVRSLGLLSTTSPHGAKSAAKASWAPLKGHHVVILPDQDKEGEQYACNVAELAKEAGALSVRLVRLPELPEAGDIADFLPLRGGDKAKVRAEVEALADAAPPMWQRESPPPPPSFNPIAASDLIREYPELRPARVDGLLREGEVMNVIAAPKIGKSWLIHLLAVLFALGRPWLGKSTSGGRVLLIDGELHRETLAHRLGRVQRVGCVDTVPSLDVWPVRGRRYTIDDLVHLLEAVPKGRYSLVIIDALYRFLPIDGEENSNETMVRVYNALDALAERLGAAVVVIHHATKGSQANKAVTDMGAGGGAQSRAADAHLILRQHQVEGAVVVEAVVRSWPPMPAFVIRWNNPGWVLAPDLDPTKILKPSGKRAPREATMDDELDDGPEDWSVEEFVEGVMTSTPRIKEDIIAAAKGLGLSKSAAGDLFKRGLSAGAIHRWIVGMSQPHRYASVPQPTPEKGEGSSGRPPPVPCAPGGCGGDAHTPPPPPPPPSPSTTAERPANGEDDWAEVP